MVFGISGQEFACAATSLSRWNYPATAWDLQVPITKRGVRGALLCFEVPVTLEV